MDQRSASANTVVFVCFIAFGSIIILCSVVSNYFKIAIFWVHYRYDWKNINISSLIIRSSVGHIISGISNKLQKIEYIVLIFDLICIKVRQLLWQFCILRNTMLCCHIGPNLSITTLPSATTSVPCYDRLNNCAEYGKDSCTGIVFGWAKYNCQEYCDLCNGKKI